MADLRQLDALGRSIVAAGYERSDKVAALFDRTAEGMAAMSLAPGEARLPPLAQEGPRGILLGGGARWVPPSPAGAAAYYS